MHSLLPHPARNVFISYLRLPTLLDSPGNGSSTYSFLPKGPSHSTLNASLSQQARNSGFTPFIRKISIHPQSVHSVFRIFLGGSFIATGEAYSNG